MQNVNLITSIFQKKLQKMLYIYQNQVLGISTRYLIAGHKFPEYSTGHDKTHINT
jgi:uncharacterized protein YwgA